MCNGRKIVKVRNYTSCSLIQDQVLSAMKFFRIQLLYKAVPVFFFWGQNYIKKILHLFLSYLPLKFIFFLCHSLPFLFSIQKTKNRLQYLLRLSFHLFSLPCNCGQRFVFKNLVFFYLQVPQ